VSAPDAVPYWPFFCEENAWRLLATTELVTEPAEAMLIANRGGRVACWRQRAAGPCPDEGPGEPIAWDYHVVVAERGRGVVWDPESCLGPVVPMRAWLEATFLDPAAVRARFHPRFRPVPRATWVERFTTDRRHMRRADGSWLRPPPPWPAPHGVGPDPRPLARWLDQDEPGWLDRAALEARWGVAR